MAGTVEGGKRAAATNKQRYGSDFYKRIGAAGGVKSKGGGFAFNHERSGLLGQPRGEDAAQK